MEGFRAGTEKMDAWADSLWQRKPPQRKVSRMQPSGRDQKVTETPRAVAIPSVIRTFHEFSSLVDQLGFMPLSANRTSFPSVEGLTERSAWHTGLETDPWVWRIRIVDERRAAYAKLFQGKLGFVSLEWYPVFLAARRRGEDVESVYRDGLLGHAAKRIYLLFDENPDLATHEIKALAGFGRDSKSEYESGIVELQMSMFVTVQGMTRMTSRRGEPHSWPATSFTTVERWAGPEMIEQSLRMDPEGARDRIIERVAEIVPGIDPGKAARFAGFLGMGWSRRT